MAEKTVTIEINGVEVQANAGQMLIEVTGASTAGSVGYALEVRGENDLEMYLIDGSCTDTDGDCQSNCAKAPNSPRIIESTADGNAAESITVTASGTYFLEICAAQGASCSGSV